MIHNLYMKYITEFIYVYDCIIICVNVDRNQDVQFKRYKEEK